jgi:hypothetical protein
LIDEYEQKVKNTTQQKSKSSPSKASTSFAKSDSKPNVVGFARGLEAEKIIGVTEYGLS